MPRFAFILVLLASLPARPPDNMDEGLDSIEEALRALPDPTTFDLVNLARASGQ